VKSCCSYFVLSSTVDTLGEPLPLAVGGLQLSRRAVFIVGFLGDGRLAPAIFSAWGTPADRPGEAQLRVKDPEGEAQRQRASFQPMSMLPLKSQARLRARLLRWARRYPDRPCSGSPGGLALIMEHYPCDEVLMAVGEARNQIR
jgi:hypothetical protein